MCLGRDLNPQGLGPADFKSALYANSSTEACSYMRRGWELHPRIRVLQTLALLLGHHALAIKKQYQNYSFFSISSFLIFASNSSILPASFVLVSFKNSILGTGLIFNFLFNICCIS